MHTLLSVLGIIIGVAALVAILSLIDGMEKFAKDQVSQTTSLQTLVIDVIETKKVDGVRIRKDTFGTLSFEKIRQLQREIDIPFTASMFVRYRDQLQISGTDSIAASHIMGVSNPGKIYQDVISGENLSITAIDSGEHVMIVNEALGKLLTSKSGSDNAIGMEVHTLEKIYKIIGVVGSARMEDVPQAFVPLSTFPKDLAASLQRGGYADAESIEDVPALEDPDRKLVEDQLQ